MSAQKMAESAEVQSQRIAWVVLGAGVSSALHIG